MKRDLYTEVTDTIIAQIEDGAGNWVMPWTGHGGGLPFNATTGNTYRGINVPILWSKARALGYAANQWASYKQWLKAGAQVRKGEKGTAIVFYRAVERETADGGTDTIRFLRYFTVFNADQVDGYEVPAVKVVSEAERIDACDDFARNTGAVIRWDEGRAYYSPMADYVGMPGFDQFVATDHSSATENAYSTLFHELTHWTGHQERVARDLSGRFGSDAYAMEELIAEMGAAFTCATLGISAEPRRDHAQYLDHWLKVLREDNKAIFTAAAKSSEALDYLDGLQFADEPDPGDPLAIEHKPDATMPLFEPTNVAA